MTKKMKNTVVASKAYERLVRTVQAQMLKAKQVIGHQYVLFYWSTGKAMNSHLMNPRHVLSIRALARQLSENLHIHYRTLEQCVQFYRAYPTLNRGQLLTWSHYRRLISIGSAKERSMWEKRAVTQGMNSKELFVLLSESRRQQTGAGTKTRLPKPKKGVFYHYRLIKVSMIHDAPGGMMVDCGFGNRIMPPPANGQLKAHRFVRAENTGDGYTLKMANVTKDDIFTYRALIERVVDGDTLLAAIDCGFGIYSRQYLRLKGIDAPEVSTEDGLRAKRFVEERLKRGDVITVKTHQSGKYGRYLADVWVEGVYLNQLLLDRNFASVYKKNE